MPTYVVANEPASIKKSLTAAIQGADFVVLIPCSGEKLTEDLTLPPQDSALPADPEEKTARLLYELNVPPYRVGYKQLLSAIPLFAKDPNQSLSKEIYPRVAEALAYSDWKAVEHSVRDVILTAWAHRDPAVWKNYFPNDKKPPSNKLFIATLAGRLK